MVPQRPCCQGAFEGLFLLQWPLQVSTLLGVRQVGEGAERRSERRLRQFSGSDLESQNPRELLREACVPGAVSVGLFFFFFFWVFGARICMRFWGG